MGRKVSFPSDDTVKKTVYLSLMDEPIYAYF